MYLLGLAGLTFFWRPLAQELHRLTVIDLLTPRGARLNHLWGLSTLLWVICLCFMALRWWMP